MKYKILTLSVISIMSSVMLIGCIKSEEPPSAQELLDRNLQGVDKTRLASDLQIIDDSLQRWFITPLKEPNGVRYTIETQGSGTNPTLESYITFNYKGMFLSNHNVFDQGTNATYRLSDLIIGWQTTLPLLNEGTKATLYIPSGFGYGPYARTDNNGVEVIPANSNLIFEIEIVDVQ